MPRPAGPGSGSLPNIQTSLCSRSPAGPEAGAAAIRSAACANESPSPIRMACGPTTFTLLASGAGKEARDQLRIEAAGNLHQYVHVAWASFGAPTRRPDPCGAASPVPVGSAWRCPWPAPCFVRWLSQSAGEFSSACRLMLIFTSGIGVSESPVCFRRSLRQRQGAESEKKQSPEKENSGHKKPS